MYSCAEFGPQEIHRTFLRSIYSTIFLPRNYSLQIPTAPAGPTHSASIQSICYLITEANNNKLQMVLLKKLTTLVRKVNKYTNKLYTGLQELYV